jgi:parallel beta-helix repeat protein
MKRKYLAVGIILLFIGTAVIPSNAELIDNRLPYSNNINSTKEIKNNFQNRSIISDNRFYYDAYGHHEVNPHYADKIKTDLNQPYYNNSYSSYTDKIFKSTETSHIIYVPDDYPTIQLAIDAASANDTIIVRDGVYTGNLIVNKSLIIQSEHGYLNCTIKEQYSNQDIIQITSDFVSIIGFFFLGSEQGQNSGISHYHVNHTAIIGNKFDKIFYSTRAEYSNDNIFHDNIIGSSGLESWGIWLQYISNNTIYNNLIYWLEYYAVPIHLYSASNTTVYNNVLVGSYDMGLLYSTNCRIYNNSMGYSTWETIHIEHSQCNLMTNNTCHSGFYDGIAFYQSDNNSFTYNTCDGGIALYESHHNIFKNNTVNNKALIVLENVNDYTITEDAGQIILLGCNNITTSHQDLSNINRGLELDESNQCYVSDSTFIGDHYDGIYAVYSNDNVFWNLTVASCMSNGISLDHCNGTEIGFCVLKYNWYNLGIGDCNHSYIHNNSLPGNDQYGIEMVRSNNTLFYFNNVSGYNYGFTAFEIQNSDNTRLLNNIIHVPSNQYLNIGLAIAEGSHQVIENNQFIGTWSFRAIGIYNETIKNNLFFDSSPHSDGNFITIEGNKFIKSTFNVNQGMELIIRQNDFLNDSMLNLAGLPPDFQGNVTIESNLFQNNSCSLGFFECQGIIITANNFFLNKDSTVFSKDLLLRQIFKYFKYRQQWSKNYWNNWNHSGSYAIKGICTFYFVFLNVVSFPIFKFHCKEYDPTPAQEPYDIPGMR